MTWCADCTCRYKNICCRSMDNQYFKDRAEDPGLYTATDFVGGQHGCSEFIELCTQNIARLRRVDAS